MTRIEQFGWTKRVEPGIGRIVSAHGDYYHLVCNEQPSGEVLARKKKSQFRESRLMTRDSGGAHGTIARIANREPRTPVLQPITGDFVRFRYNARGESMITEIMPRFSHFERRDPNARRQAQTLAVNFNTLFIMMSLNENFSVPRVARFLDLAADVGAAEVVVVVTKVDLRQPGDEAFLSDLAGEVAGRARILEISAKTGEGLEAVRAHVRPRETVAFLGSSGVGKSTLVNVLAGEEWMATQEIQDWSGKGRHTTTSRELVLLPSGALVLDTPGVREIGRPDEPDGRLVKGESSHRWRKKE